MALLLSPLENTSSLKLHKRVSLPLACPPVQAQQVTVAGPSHSLTWCDASCVCFRGLANLRANPKQLRSETPTVSKPGEEPGAKPWETSHLSLIFQVFTQEVSPMTVQVESLDSPVVSPVASDHQALWEESVMGFVPWHTIGLRERRHHMAAKTGTFVLRCHLSF